MNFNQEVIYIHRYLSGEMDTKEGREFKDWVESNSRNRDLFSEVSAIWNASSTFPALKFDAKKALLKHKLILEQEKTTPLDSVHQVSEDPKPKIISLKPWLAIAAAIIFILATWFIFSDSAVVEYNPAQATVASLHDGSKVLMEKGTNLKFKEKSHQRLVELSGKAYFEVKGDKARPFTILANGMEVRVFGTKFTVDTEKKSVFVKEGIVEVLYQGDKAIITSNKMVSVQNDKLTASVDMDFYKSSLWLNDELIFNKTPFDIVIKDISEYFHVTFKLPQGKDWSNCTFTSGSLINNTLDEIITTLKLTYELDCVKLDDQNYKISKVKCR